MKPCSFPDLTSLESKEIRKRLDGFLRPVVYVALKVKVHCESRNVPFYFSFAIESENSCVNKCNRLL